MSFSSAEEYFLGKNKLLWKEVIPQLKFEMKKNKTEVVFLRADYNLSYGKVARLISHLKKSGINQVALVTMTDKESK